MDELPDDSALLRFMSFSKFVDLITFSRAWFASVAALQADDPLEGVLPAANHLVESGLAGKLGHLVNYSMARSLGVGPEADRLRASPREPAPTTDWQTVFGTFNSRSGLDLSTLLARQRAWIDVQCWHAGATESVAMWKIYGGPEPSVAVRSTVGGLRAGIKVDAGADLRISAVEYVDHATTVCGNDNPLSPMLRKGLAFEYEREVRALIYTPSAPIAEQRAVPGRSVSVDLATLVDAVVIAPTAPDWFADLVAEIVAAKLDVPVTRSAINRAPWLC